MPKISSYTRTRIELLDKQGLPPVGILRSLKSEGLAVSLSSVTRIIKKLRITGSVANRPRSGRPAKLSSREAQTFINRKSRRRSVQNTSIMFCTKQSQLWWRLKVLQPSIKTALSGATAPCFVECGFGIAL